jgi:hypothetical protein
VGVSYSADLNVILGVAGGVKPYTFSLSSGSLPTGLTLSPSGVVSGTPSGAGSKSFSVTVVSNGLTLNNEKIKNFEKRFDIETVVLQAKSN